MFNRITLFINLLRAGQEVGNPKQWKSIQNAGNAIGAVILILFAIAKDYGYDFEHLMSEQMALVIGGVIASVWNIVLVYATSGKVGLLPPKQPADGFDPMQTQYDNGDPPPQI